MSGGVDSSVAAALLLEQGYNVIGITMSLHNSAQGAGSSVETDAKRVADALGIPHHVVDLSTEFKNHVTDYFINEYRRGRTPNPCIVCNHRIKFGAMLNAARELGADCVATGHYADIAESEGRWRLMCAADERKDQTYFLNRLTQEQFSCAVLPLSGIDKARVRAVAQGLGLTVADKKDSQEICFIPDGDYAAYIERQTGKSPVGEFIFGGKAVGEHNGIIRYTVGQRKGLGIALGEPVFITKIDPAANRIYLGTEGSQYKRELTASEMNWISTDGMTRPFRCRAKIRYNARAADCEVFPDGDGVRVTFDTPQKAVTPGQSVVFYDENSVIGGGIINA